MLFPDGQTDALVKLTGTSGQLLQTSKTVAALLLAGGNVTGDTTTTLTVQTGLIGFAGNGSLNVANLQLGDEGKFFTVADGNVGDDFQQHYGRRDRPDHKGGRGTLILNTTVGSQFTGQFNINEGAVNIRNGAALGSPSGATIVNNGRSSKSAREVSP